MENQKQKDRQLCKKLAYGIKEDPSIILGIVVSEDDSFITFRTARREYKISKSMVLSIGDTDQEFRGDN